MDETSGQTMGPVPSAASALSAVRRLRHRHILARLDYLRELRRLAGGMTQAELARELGLTQPSISSALKSAAKVAELPAGFSGASVYEIAQRFTAGELGRDDLVDQLSRWPDATAFDPPSGQTEHPPLRELSKAMHDGLLDEPVYRAVLDRRKPPRRLTAEMLTNAASGQRGEAPAPP